MTASGQSAPKSDYARRRRRPWLWLTAAVTSSAVVLGVAWVLDHEKGPVANTPTGTGPVTPLVPSGLTPEERTAASSQIAARDPIKLQAGGWVQVAGPDGRLKQQYAASRTDPLPDKRMSMVDPRAVLYGSQGRVVTMRSDTMVARVPKGELESGRLEGNVIIRVYKPQGDRPVDLAVDSAEMIIEAPEAEFDSRSAEIRVDRSVRVTSAALSGSWEGLSLTLSQDGKSIERLVTDRPLSPIRIERSAEVLRKRGEGMKPGTSGAAPVGDTGDESFLCVWAPEPPPRTYLLTFHDNVHVVSAEPETTVTMDGNMMQAIFVLEGSMDGGIARVDPHGAETRALNMPLETPPAMRVLAAAADPQRPTREAQPAADESITITYTGRMVMEPLGTDVPPLAHPKGVRIVMHGAPARVEDSKSQSVITAERVSFESEVEEVHLTGSPEKPARVENPDFVIAAPLLQLNRSSGKGSVQGAGSLRMGRLDTQQQPLTVAWADEARFTLVPGTPKKADGTFRTATFVGDVRVRGADFAMDSGTLMVESEPVGEKDVLRKLVADQGVVASNLTESGGRLEAGRVEVLLQPDDEANARPRSLTATGGVVVTDPQQTLWAPSVRAIFVAATKKKAAKDDRLSMGGDKMQLGSVVAEGPVALLLKDGTRVWASRLEGDAVARTAQLLGPNVVVVRGNSVIDQLSEVRVQDAPGKLSAAGVGRVSYYTERVIPETRERMSLPSLPQVPQMQATWREGMAYVEGAVPGKLGAPDRGLLLLQGAVKVRAARSAVEEESLDADEVQLETLPQVADAKPSKGGRTAPESGTSASNQDMGQVARMVARGNVDIRAKSWPTAQKQGEPKFFRLQSQSAVYDVPAGLCSVEGAGSILVSDPIVAQAVASSKEKTDLPFSPQGVTKFTWQRSLGMRRIDQALTTIALDGNVEMQHVGAETAGNGTLLADHLEATVRSPETEVAERKPTPGGAAATAAPVLGAGATLEHVLARGRVIVRTVEYDIETGEFSLDERTQVATMTATPGRVVTIQKRGVGGPQRAQSAVWDMKAGTIIIERLRGAISR
jgi:hypothetical protein